MTMLTEPSNSNSEVIVATGGYDHTVKLWHAKTGVCQRTFQHAGSVSFIKLITN